MFGYVPDFSTIVQDFAEYVMDTAEEYPLVPVFVIGQSVCRGASCMLGSMLTSLLQMGGAVALLSTLRDGPLHDRVRGCVLLAPMCRISEVHASMHVT